VRLDLAVAQRFGLPRRKARDAVRSGRIEAGGATCDEPGRDVPEDVALTFHPDRPARRRVRARIEVLAETPDFLIVNKPAGLLTVPTGEGERDTLLARALDYLHRRYRRRPWVGIVHRLDRDTSGALVFARSRPAQAALKRQFREHTIRREYVAILEGDVARPRGTLDRDLAREATTRRRSIARRPGEGRRAVTHYEVRERLGNATLVSVRLETGRTHQIRIHFAETGHPVLGDRVYRPPRLPEPPLDVARQMLHARLLGFDDPGTGKPVEAASPLPEDFTDALTRLRRLARQKKKEPRKTRGS
jgi:23S rRNA pseudouridine1911/1915/1917 synthase